MDPSRPAYFLRNTSLTTDSDSRSTLEVVVQATSMAFIMLSGCIGNILILLAIYIDRTLQTVTNSFLINLALADLLLCLIGMPFTLVSSVTYDWIFGATWCNINGMSNSLFCVASILTLAAVSIDRYIAIIHPLRYASYMTKKTASCMILYIWTHSLLISLLPVFGWSEYAFLKKESICTVQWQLDISCTVFIFVVCFFLPLAVMVYTYSRILRTAWTQSKRLVPVTGRISLREKDLTQADSSTNLSRNLSDGSLDSRYQVSRDTVSTYDRSSGSQSTDEFLTARTQDKKPMPLRMLENNYTQEFESSRMSQMSYLYTNEHEDTVTMNLDKKSELSARTLKETRLRNTSSPNVLVNKEGTEVIREKNSMHKERLLSIGNANNNEFYEPSTSFNSKIKDTSAVNSFIVESQAKEFPDSPGKMSVARNNVHRDVPYPRGLEKEMAIDQHCKEDGYSVNRCDGSIGFCHSMDNKSGQKDTICSSTGINHGNEPEQSPGSSTRGSVTSDEVFLPSGHDATEKQLRERDIETNSKTVSQDAARQNKNRKIIHFQTTRKERISVVVSADTANDSPQQPEKRQRRVTIASYPASYLERQVVNSKSTPRATNYSRREKDGANRAKSSGVSRSTQSLQEASSPVSLRVENGTSKIKRKLSNWSNPAASIQALKKKYTNNTAGLLKMKQDRKAVRTLLIVVGTFVLCWLPHFIGIFCLVTNECTWPDRYFAITTWLAMLNSGCNPVIYGAMSRQFRKRFRQILQCKRGFF